MPHRRRYTFGPVVSAGALGVIAVSMLAAGGLSLGTPRSAAARVPAALSTGTPPLTRVIGINIAGGYGSEQPTAAELPAEIHDAAVNLHVTWIRYNFDWWRINPTGGSVYDWSAADAIMQAAAQSGVGVVAILGSQYWPSSTAVIPSVSQWQAFVTAFTQRYDQVWKPAGLRGLVEEPWNEPENNWSGTAQQWATQIQLPAYQAAKAVDPSVLIAMDTTDWASGGQAWWKAVASALAGQTFVDLPGFHDYANSTASWNSTFRSFLASYRVHYVAVWADEFGVGMAPPAPFDDTAHITVLQSQIPPVLNGSSVDGIFYYAYCDLAEGGAVHESYGLENINGSHYQSYSVFQQLVTGTAPPLAPTPAPPPPSSPPVAATPAPSTPVATKSASPSARAASPSASAGTASSTPTGGGVRLSPPSPTPTPTVGSIQAEAGSGRPGGTGVPLAVPLGVAALVLVGGGLVAIGLVPGLRRWPPTLRS